MAMVVKRCLHFGGHTEKGWEKGGKKKSTAYHL